MIDDLDYLTTVLEGHISTYVRDVTPHDPTGIATAVAYVQMANIAMRGLHDVRMSDVELQKAIQKARKDIMGSLTAISFVLMVASITALRDREVDE